MPVGERRSALLEAFRGARLRATLAYGALALALIVAVVWAGDDIGHHIDGIEAWIERGKPWSVLAFIGLYAVATSLLVPDSLLSVVAGAAFGMTWGLAAVVAGSLLGAALQYALARRLLRPRIERSLERRPSLSAIQRAVRQDELRLQTLLRLTPLNPATTSYLLGAAGVRFGGFVLACLALIPVLCFEVYLGVAGTHVARTAGDASHGWSIHDTVLVFGVVVTLAVVVVVSRMARRALVEAVSTEGAASTEVPASGTRAADG